MDKKKLLFIIEHLNTGGAERSLLDLLTCLDYTVYSVDLLLIQDTGVLLSEIPIEVNVILYSLKNSFGPITETVIKAIRNKDSFSLRFRLLYMFCSRFGWNYLRYAGGMFKKLKKQYDAVIAYRHSICADFAAYAFCADKRICWWHHGNCDFDGPTMDRLNHAFKKMTAIVAVSPANAQVLKTSFPDSAQKIIVVPNMIRSSVIQEKAAKQQVSRPPHTLILTSVGRLSKEKNMHFCIECGSLLLKKGIDFHWYIIGDGEEYDSIQDAISIAHLNNRFTLTGQLSNPYPLIKASDVLFHPSQVESQGLVVLEAMTLSVPVVAAISDGVCAYLRDSVNGFLVSLSPEEAVEKILLLYYNPSIRRDIIKNALNTVELYSQRETVSRFDHLFLEEEPLNE